jgi:pyruvate, orthophosphate dikinase
MDAGLRDEMRQEKKPRALKAKSSVPPRSEQIARPRKFAMIFSFDHPHTDQHTELRRRLGGKGFSLWLMTHELGLPVPPGFTIETSQCRRFLVEGSLSALEAAVREHMSRIETALDRMFGHPIRPLTVSIRSGAASSMPGMMDTVLNVGLTPQTTEALAALSSDPVFALQSYRRFLASYAEIVLGAAMKDHAFHGETEAELSGEIASLRAHIAKSCPLAALDDPWHQLFSTIAAVFKSWNSPRAMTYRARERIADDLGTAVNVQAMVFGNLDRNSGTGVAFTRNPSTGDAAPCGDFLFRAQGDDVVGGTHRTLPLEAFASAMPEAYAELHRAMEKLEIYYRDLCDIEFTVEHGRLWMLQARIGKRSAAAAPKIAVDLVCEGKVALGRGEAVRRIDPDILSGAIKIERATAPGKPIAQGIGTSPGTATGHVVFDPDRAVDLAETGTDLILVRRETSPEDVHGMGVAKGILTTLGGMMSHAAVVARAWNIPAVCGVADVELTENGLVIGNKIFREGDVLSIDGDSGAVYSGTIDSEASIDPYLETLRSWAAESETDKDVTFPQMR